MQFFHNFPDIPIAGSTPGGTAMPQILPNRLPHWLRHCRYIGDVQQGWNQTLPIYRQCLTRECQPRVQPNTADISAVSMYAIYRRSTANIKNFNAAKLCRYIGSVWQIGSANVRDLLAVHRQYECDVAARDTGITIALLRLYTFCNEINFGAMIILQLGC